MPKRIPVKNNKNQKLNQRHRKSGILNRLAKSSCFLIVLIMICVFLTCYLTSSETLPEYASNNLETEDKTEETNTTSINDNDTSTEYITVKNTEDITADINPERTTYQTGFYYEPLTDTVKQRITGISYPVNGCTIPYEELNYVGLLYIDFNGMTQQGELICNRALAQDMVEIFYELYQNGYQIERIRLIDDYGGDDIASMKDNNTSCFNYRVIDGTTSLSNHAYGLAIDINPFYNPYVIFDRNGAEYIYISPDGSEKYADRSQDFIGKIDENDLCYRLFISHGFTWGGDWNTKKDYQHFEKKL